MSRRPLGKAGRTQTKTVKLTTYEVEYLEQKYGSASSGLRAALNQMLPETVNDPGRVPRPGSVIAQQDHLFSDRSTCGPLVTDHPGWVTLARGRKTRTVIKACRVCGQRVTEKEQP